MMLDKPVFVTSKGLLALREELAYLQNVKRPQVIEQLQESKGDGDWMDTSEYLLFEEDLAFVNGRIQEIVYMLDHAQLIEPDNEDDQIDVGETVVVQRAEGEIETYTIVGIAETDPSKGFISNESPLGQALLNHKVGDEVIVHAPMGEIRYRIIAFKPS